MQKSTTISPSIYYLVMYSHITFQDFIQTNFLKKCVSVISKALNQTIKRRVKGMSDGLQKNRFIDLSVKLKDPENHFAYTTIPWIISTYFDQKYYYISFSFQE